MHKLIIITDFRKQDGLLAKVSSLSVSQQQLCLCTVFGRKNEASNEALNDFIDYSPCTSIVEQMCSSTGSIIY